VFINNTTVYALHKQKGPVSTQAVSMLT